MDKIYVQTYGCTSNKSDSQYMMGIMNNAGYEITENENEADYILVNTCAVKSKTEEKIISRLKKLSKKDKKIIIGGCLTKVNPERIKKAVPEFHGMLDTKSIGSIDKIIKEGGIVVSENPPEKPLLPRISISEVIDIVKISEGCLSSCSFCATKLARGKLFSYRPENIRDAVIQGLKDGHKEFHMASEDSSAYGRDIETSLPDLIRSVSNIEGDFMIRVGMMNPLHFKKVEIDDLIDAYKKEKVFKFLHLCVQTGSDKILGIMKRGYVLEDFKYYIKKFREEIPEITIWSDIIVGHPGEEEEDFEKSIELLREIKPDFVNISSYGTRSGTESTKMKQINSEIKKERTRKLSKIMDEIILEKNKKWIGWEGKILIDEFNHKKNSFIGRNYTYKPVVIKGNVKLGDFVNVSIKDTKNKYLLGEIKK